MILYSVNYLGPQTNYEWSIVTIHKTLEGAEIARNKYINGQEKNNNYDYKYCIVEIDTNDPDDCIYDYDNIDLYNCYYIDDEYDELEDDEND